MTSIFIITLLFAVLSCVTYGIFSKNNKFLGHHSGIVILTIIGLVVRTAAALSYPGHETDMSCFAGWADMVFGNGFSEFYTSDAFTDYPPGYMYVLYGIGFLRNVFNFQGAVAWLIVKLPAIICDILCGFAVYKICKNRNNSMRLCFAAFFILNPAVILNSSVWGQVDSVFTLIVLYMLYALNEKKLYQSYYLFAAAILIKPQALFYAPVLAYGIIEQVFLSNCSPKRIIKHFLSGMGAIACAILLALPFGLENVLTQYIGTLNSYAYASVNAYNLWAALGMNFSELTPALSALGYIFIVLIVVASAYIFFVKKQKNRYFFVSAFICFAVFMLSVKMHERYAFPAIALMLCASALSDSKIEFAFFEAISAQQFINAAHILFYYGTSAQYFVSYKRIELFTGIASVILLIAIISYAFHREQTVIKKKTSSVVLQHMPSLQKKDLVLMLFITLLYACIAFYNLGDKTAPKTYETISPDAGISADFGNEYDISAIKFYPGAINIDSENAMTISLSDENKNVLFQKTIDSASVFTWQEITDISVSARYIDITSHGELQLFEVGIITGQGKIVTPNSSLKIFDEYYEVPCEISYRNSMYFDEIYHARTAYEFIREMPVYEWTHPPLGKAIIAVGIKLFGMTPFGWRVMGTLFGVLMLPIMYVFSKKMFGSSWLSVCVTLIFAFDFMHFAQTRIATIDVYVTFFIILMYLMMYKYCFSSPRQLSYKKSFSQLLLCGIFMGLAISCKWTGAYAGIGLAILFFATFFTEYGIRFYNEKKAKLTIAFCFAAFVLVPILIYAAAYIPYLRANSGGFGEIIQNQIDMLSYHGKTVLSSTHPFSSSWYEWVINYRPIWYYTGTTESGLCENISSFGNPLVWIVGLAAFIYCAYDGIRNKNKRARFLAIAYLAQLLPWIPVTRITFIYHYFPCVPFLALMIGHAMNNMYERNKNVKYACYIFTTLVILTFFVFYPAISGYPVNGDYVRDFLRWLPSWQLIN